MEDEIQKVEQVAKKGWPVVMSWVGGITALLVLFASLAGGIAWFVNHPRQKTEIQAKIALAQEQEKQGQYPAQFQVDEMATTRPCGSAFLMSDSAIC